jgi:hypothetical protein
MTTTTTTTPTRPTSGPARIGEELMRWYRLRKGLAMFARHVGVSTAGNKEAHQQRLAAYLNGRPPPTPARAGRSGVRLTGLLTENTLGPGGTGEALMTGCHEYRSLPVEGRGRAWT